MGCVVNFGVVVLKQGVECTLSLRDVSPGKISAGCRSALRSVAVTFDFEGHSMRRIAHDVKVCFVTVLAEAMQSRVRTG